MPIESHAKILVVEDDATVRNLVLTALEAQSFDLFAESTGRGAIASAATNAPDVVLLDLGLPDIDGIEVVRAIRVWSQMPIIVVSARSEDADKIAAFENGELRIDYSAGVAYLSGEELHLTPIEYKLLCLLSHNVDRVLTHSFILNEVWGVEHQADLASLRVFMGTLRKKIESDPAHPRYIQTHVGVGYRMIRATADKD